MAVDKAGNAAESGPVALHAVLTEALTEAGRDREWLRDLLGVSEPSISRYLSGKQAITLELVRRIEDALDLGRGEILRRAGYVDGEVTTEQAIAADPRLSDRTRRLLRGLYRELTQ